MNTDLSFITNEGNQSLKERFRVLIKSTSFFDCLVGYFYSSGFHAIYPSLETTEKIRILIGISTSRTTLDMLERANRPTQQTIDFSHAEAKQEVENLVQLEMEDSEDNRKVEEGVHKFIEWIGGGKLEIRAYPSQNIHAKLYIMTFKEGDRDTGRIITGSSNFTQSGLVDNLEFNVELKNRSDYDFAQNKFEELWCNAVDVSEKYVQTIQGKTWLTQNITPYQLYLKFLNRGLFDPKGSDRGYNWVDTEILLTNKLFSNTNKTREGDIGDGILDVFDRYNFTVKEDEPLEKEVAIDPELLGKAYEKFNAIRPDNYAEFKKALKSGKKGEESKFNKKFGVYYTPCEIVHYMCQQSLINYLFTELNSGGSSYEKPGDPNLNMFGNDIKEGQLYIIIKHTKTPEIPKEDLETLIQIGEHVSENEAYVLSAGRETKTYSHKLPESIRNSAKLIDQKLADITVCDPAVGSGVFPVRMMSEIVKVRNILTHFINRRLKPPDNS